jgi:hypothetical protein
MGIADDGEPVELSPDPLREQLESVVSGVRFGDDDSKVISPILRNRPYGTWTGCQADKKSFNDFR